MSTSKQPTYGEVWKTLSQINVSEHAASKNGFNYLSWTWAWQMLMENYPDAAYSFEERINEGTQTVETICTVTIGSLSRSMWLPVMDHRNKAIPNPDFRAISDCRMRALVKTIGMYGLGLHIYQGEAIPDALMKEEASEEEVASVRELLVESGSDEAALLNYLGTGIQPGIKTLEQLRSIHVPGLIAVLEGKVEKAKQERAA